MNSGIETITIFGRKIRVKNETRRVDQLRLNEDNPRLRHEIFLKKKEVLTEDLLEESLWKMDSTKRLYRTILSSGGIQNPLVIRESGTVIEGSRRTVVARKLKSNLDSGALKGEEAIAAKAIIESIPVKVLPNDISEKEIDVMLAREHISGKYPWPAVNQAEHIFRMHHVSGFPIETIAEVTERSRPWVYQKLTAFEWTERYLKNNPRGSLEDYSYFEELYKKATALKKVAGFDPEDPKDRDHFHSLISTGKIPMAIDVRKLPLVLTDSEARKVLEEEGIERAWITAKTKNPRVASPTFQALAEATEALQTIPRNEYLDIAQDQAKKQLVFELYHEIEKVLADLKLK